MVGVQPFESPVSEQPLSELQLPDPVTVTLKLSATIASSETSEYVSPSSEFPSNNQSSTSLSDDEVNTSGNFEQFNESTVYNYDENYNVNSDSNDVNEAEFGDVVSPDTSAESGGVNSSDMQN